MTQRLTGVALALTVAGSAVAYATNQVAITSTQGAPPILGDFPGLQNTGAKPMEIGSGVITGRVADGVEGGGISGAIVTLTLAGFNPMRVQADSEGRFAFRSLPTGTYSIASARPGYVDGASGRVRPGGPARGVSLTAEKPHGEAELLMWRFAVISGTVLDEHNEPLIGVQVRVLRRDYVAGRRRLTVGTTDTTDDRGQYRISALPAGEYIVALPMIRRPSVDGVISGLRDGMPAMGGGGGDVMVATRVQVTSTMAAGGVPMIMSSLGGGVPPAGTTEDGLPLTYQTEFYTGAVSVARATPITLAAGEERSGVDFRIAPVRAMTVAGTLTGPEGPAPNVQLQLIPADSDELTSPIETATTSTDGNGHFTFDMVPAGQYTLRALRQPRGGGGASETFMFSQDGGATSMTVRQTIERVAMSAPLPDTPTLWTETAVGLGARDIVDLNVTLRTGLTVSGTVTFSGSATQPTPEQRGALNVMLEPADGRTAGLLGMVRGRVDPTGTFTTMGAPAGKYILRVTGAPQGWSLRDASHGGKDITSTAIELNTDSAIGVVLTFTDRPTELNGMVRGVSGNADVRASVIVFPTDQSLWVDTGAQPRRLRQVRAGQDGSYTIGGLPAGEYFVVAVDDATTADWQDPAFLSQIAREATAVRLTEGDARTQALTTVKGGR